MIVGGILVPLNTDSVADVAAVIFILILLSNKNEEMLFVMRSLSVTFITCAQADRISSLRPCLPFQSSYRGIGTHV